MGRAWEGGLGVCDGCTHEGSPSGFDPTRYRGPLESCSRGYLLVAGMSWLRRAPYFPLDWICILAPRDCL